MLAEAVAEHFLYFTWCEIPIRTFVRQCGEKWTEFAAALWEMTISLCGSSKGDVLCLSSAALFGEKSRTNCSWEV